MTPIEGGGKEAVLPASILRTGFSKVKSNRDVLDG